MPKSTAFIYNKLKEYGAYHGTTATFTVTLSKPSTAQLATVNAVGRRCWDCLELRYRNTPGDKMRYTWANDNENWYGGWHFEIIATLAYMLQTQSGIPDGVDAAKLRQRLVETKIWLANNVR